MHFPAQSSTYKTSSQISKFISFYKSIVWRYNILHPNWTWSISFPCHACLKWCYSTTHESILPKHGVKEVLSALGTTASVKNFNLEWTWPNKIEFKMQNHKNRFTTCRNGNSVWTTMGGTRNYTYTKPSATWSDPRFILFTPQWLCQCAMVTFKLKQTPAGDKKRDATKSRVLNCRCVWLFNNHWANQGKISFAYGAGTSFRTSPVFERIPKNTSKKEDLAKNLHTSW